MDIYTIDIDGIGLKALTFASQYDGSPVWSPDGSRIAFVSKRDGNTEIYVMRADGTGQTRLTFLGGSDFSPTWSPDGKIGRAHV